ncbi:hypothetical protein MRB53_016625 [Persea americana]|uniref:Uncharacterized protein n=1 Tax=Persea americana TaxID=3435 RepID=A0ACC2M2T8_PERAE|nr:hypothetical protein MRB53_016625 [Persea americana]
MQLRSMDPSKDLATYGYGSIAWKERMKSWKQKQEKLQVMRSENGGEDWDNEDDGPDLLLMDEARQPLPRKMHIPSSQINPYRMYTIIWLVVLGFFFSLSSNASRARECCLCNVAPICHLRNLIPVTYAGGVTVLADLERIKLAGMGRVDVIVGSALNIFGGDMAYKDVVA